MRWGWVLALAASLGGAAAAAPLTSAEAIGRDAAQVAQLEGIAPYEAATRLRAQEASIAATDALAEEFADRVAGITVEQRPAFRIVVLLTGDAAVPDRLVQAGITAVPVTFRTGALATRTQLLDALDAHQTEILERWPRSRGIGVDPRTGELVLMLNQRDAPDPAAVGAALAQLTGVPARVRLLDPDPVDFSIDGGARITGVDPERGTRFACTSGFTVRGEGGDGIVTAAHCPDELTYQEPGGGSMPLHYVGQWGVGYQDVQVNTADGPLDPYFYADTRKTELRPVTAVRRREALRAGDIVCHRGESSGYSCAEIDLVDFAPPAPLCAGQCNPVWVSVNGPGCRGGDSGGPVFLGTTAIGLVKGGSYDREARCHFYFFMSLDYLPDGWSVLEAPVNLAEPAQVALAPAGLETK